MPTATEFSNADVVWLLSLTWAGRVFRWATSTPDTGPRVLTDEDGNVYPYEGGLRMPVVDQKVSLQATAVDGLSLGFEVLFPADVDVAELVSKGHDLSTATAEVALHLAGGFYEDRKVVLNGGLRKPAYDVAGEPVSFTVEAEGYDDGALIPAASQRVTLSTWSGRPASSQGLYYPIVFGTPGAFITSGGTSTVTSGSPAIVVVVTGSSASTLLIAGHKCAATSVRIYDADGAGEDFNTTTTTDDLGQAVTTVDVTSAVTIDRTSSEFWVGWNSGAALVDADGTTVVQSAGAVAQWMLKRSTLSVDLGRWAAVSAHLDRYTLAGFVDDSVEPSEWVNDNLLPLLPVTIASGPSGRYPILWRYDATSADALDHIEHGPGVTRLGGIQYVTLRREVTNEVRFNFAKRAKSGQAYRSVTLLAESGGSSEEFPSRRAVLSRARSGARVVELDSDVVYDQSTALAVCEDILARDAFAQRSVTYRVPNEMGYLDVGDVVTLTDSGRYFTAQVCLVEGTEWDGDVLALDLLIIEQPDRDNR